MGTKVDKKSIKRLVGPRGNVMKPHLRKFLKVKSLGPEPALNVKGFWPKPNHGIKIDDEKDRK